MSINTVQELIDWVEANFECKHGFAGPYVEHPDDPSAVRRYYTTLVSHGSSEPAALMLLEEHFRSAKDDGHTKVWWRLDDKIQNEPEPNGLRIRTRVYSE